METLPHLQVSFEKLAEKSFSLEEARRQTVILDNRKVLVAVIDFVGPTMALYLSGGQEKSIIDSWLDGKPLDDESEIRLRYTVLFGAYAISEGDSEDIARSLLIGMIDSDEQISRATLIRDGRVDEVFYDVSRWLSEEMGS